MGAKLLSAERRGWDCVFRVHLDEAKTVTVVDEVDEQGEPTRSHAEPDPEFVRAYTFGPPTTPKKLPKGMDRDGWRRSVWTEHEQKVAAELRLLVAHDAAQVADSVPLVLTL